MIEQPDNRRQLKIVLLANYAKDAQESMLRFARMMHDGLIARGYSVRIIQPQEVLSTGIGGIAAKWIGYLNKYIFFPMTLRSQVRDADVVHICDHSNAVYVPYLKGVPAVVTIHDLLAVRAGLGEDTCCPLTSLGRKLQMWILSGLRQAKFAVCDSEATLQDARRLLRPDTHFELTYLGLNYPFHRMPETECTSVLSAVATLDQTRPFILHVGSSQPRKNRDGIMRVFATIQDRFDGQLVFAGSPLGDELLTLARSLNITDRIVVVEKPTDALLEALYNRALCLLFPSRSEGFGWPIIEAQACGCPVLTSNVEPCPEVAGKGAIVHDVDDTQAFADSIVRLSQNRTEREELIQLGLQNLDRFRNDAMLDAYENTYQRAAAIS